MSAAAAALPDGRGYEMVSPVDKAGNDVIGVTSRIHVSAGEAPSLPAAVTFASFGAFGDVRGTGVAIEYLAERDAAPGTSGWATHAITPRQEPLSFLAASQGFEPLYSELMSDDLTHGVFRAWSPLTDAPNVQGVPNLYLREDLRTPGDGSYQLLSDSATGLPPLAVVPANLLRRPVAAGASANFRHVLFEDRENLTADASGDNVKLYKADDGVVRLVADGSGACPGGATVVAPCSAAGLGATFHDRLPRVISADGARVNFSAPVLADGNVGNASRLYQLDDRGTATPADDAVAQLNASEKAVPNAPQPAFYQTASTDGSRVFFTSNEQLTDTPGSGLYMWERQPTNESQTVTVDATGGTFTLSVHAGSVDAITAPLPADADAAQVQAALQALAPIGSGNVAVSGGPGDSLPYVVTFVGALAGVDVRQLTADPSALTGGAATATVLTTQPLRNLTFIAPDADGVIGASEDGHRVYFASAANQLVPGGPAVRENAIYLWQDAGGAPSLSFVGGTTASDVNSLTNGQWTLSAFLARVTPDGRRLAFAVIDGSALAPGYQHGNCAGLPCEELYVYSADSSTPTAPDVVCASCDFAHPAAPFETLLDVEEGLGVTSRTSHQNRIVTDDGRRVFFSTAEALVPEDVNGKSDAYEYDVPTRTVHLISSGTDASDSYYLDASADGHDAYLLTRQRLVGWDSDSAYDVYDARIGGGFPDPPPAARPCTTSDACQGPALTPPAAAPLGSRAFRGLGNVPVSRHGGIKRCRRGLVRKRVHGRVRCVKRAKPGRRANAGRRAR